MTVKERLDKARDISDEIRVLEEAKTDALANAVYQSASFEEAVQASKANSRERRSIAYTQYVDALDERQTKLLMAKADAVRLIGCLEDSCDRAVMTDYYINGREAKEIADLHGYSLSGVYDKLTRCRKKIQALQDSL